MPTSHLRMGKAEAEFVVGLSLGGAGDIDQ